MINLTANTTDKVELRNGTIIVNDTGFRRFFNFSLNNEAKAEFSQVITVSCNKGCVINFTATANDSSGNIRTNDTLIIEVVERLKQLVNTTLNKTYTSILQGDVINYTANITDNVGLSFCQTIVNQSGPNAIQIINRSLEGLTSAQCSNVTEITLAAGGVINFTIIANDTSGNTRTNDTIITVISGATAPVVKLNNATFSIDPADGSSVNILVSFNVTDEQGIGNINASKAIVNFTLGDPAIAQFRANISDVGTEFGTCVNGTHTTESIVQINCTVTMRYYDNSSSAWVINVSVADIDGLVGRNDTVTFTYNELSALAFPYVFLNFSSVFLGQQDVPSRHLILNNTGNDDFDEINVSGAALVGTTTSSETIAATVFFANISNVTAGLGVPLATTPVTLRELVQPSGQQNFNATLLHGPGISGDNVPYTGAAEFVTKGNRTVHFWVDVPSSGLSSQLYNATWNVTVVDKP